MEIEIGSGIYEYVLMMISICMLKLFYAPAISKLQEPNIWKDQHFLFRIFFFFVAYKLSF